MNNALKNTEKELIYYEKNIWFMYGSAITLYNQYAVLREKYKKQNLYDKNSELDEILDKIGRFCDAYSSIIKTESIF